MKTSTSSAPLDLAAAIKGSGEGRHFRRILILVLIVLVLGGGAWFWWSRIEKAKNQAPAYVTETLKRGGISLTITATGNLAPTTEVTVGSELSGTTLEVYVDFNDRVTRGSRSPNSTPANLPSKPKAAAPPSSRRRPR